jgi:Protein of unknown function (DUF3224)
MSYSPQRHLLVVVAALLMTAVAAPAAVAADSVAVSGTFHEHTFKVLDQRTEGEDTVITRSLKVNFKGDFAGKASALEEVTLHPDGTGEVTGTIDFVGCVHDRCGTAEILFEGTLPNPEVANGTFTVVGGTGGLDGIRGRGEFLQAPDGTYTGTVRF